MGSGRFWAGLLIGIVIAIAFGLLVLPYLGLFDMSASGGRGILDWWGNTNMEHSLSRQAPNTKLPESANAEQAMGDYSATCVQCHGAPNQARESWAEHMLPEPPKLWEREMQDMTDGELFRVIKEGVRMSGMPAFGKEYKDEEIWNLVAVVRKLPRLPEEQQQQPGPNSK